jgi:hypothetical protein
MRSPPTPSSLYWLIDRHARLKGDLEVLHAAEVQHQEEFAKRLATLHHAIEELQSFEARRLKAYQRRLSELETQFQATALMIRTHEVAINPEIIRPVRSHLRERTTPPGAMTRAIYKVLGNSNGCPCTAAQVAQYLIASLSGTISESETSRVRYAVRQRMKNLTLEGKLVRCSDDPLSNLGRWTLPAHMLAKSQHETHQTCDVLASSLETNERAHS